MQYFKRLIQSFPVDDTKPEATTDDSTTTMISDIIQTEESSVVIEDKNLKYYEKLNKNSEIEIVAKD